VLVKCFFQETPEQKALNEARRAFRKAIRKNHLTPEEKRASQRLVVSVIALSISCAIISAALFVFDIAQHQSRTILAASVFLMWALILVWAGCGFNLIIDRGILRRLEAEGVIERDRRTHLWRFVKRDGQG